MSVATDRMAMREVLVGYGLLSTKQAAALLGVTVETVAGLIRMGKLPAVDRSTGTKRRNFGIDPMDAVIFLIADKQGHTVEEYWEKHGNKAADHARDYLERIRRFKRYG